MFIVPDAHVTRFQSTPLMRGETAVGPFLLGLPTISIHSPHARGDGASTLGGRRPNIRFQSTPLMRGETRCWAYNTLLGLFQSTPLMRGETLTVIAELIPCLDFNPLPSCEGRRTLSCKRLLCLLFQSTPLMRGETIFATTSAGSSTDFNPLPSCEGRPCGDCITKVIIGISIHSPHARGD